MWRLGLPQKFNQRLNNLGIPQHSNVHRGDFEVEGQFGEGLANNLRRNRLDPPDALRRLHRQGGDTCHAIAFMGSYGLDVSGDTSP